MFNYFGYGSNINLISLRAKGVEPLSSQRALLKGWGLKFNVKHWFSHEGGVGNIEPSLNKDNLVEGMVHVCKDEHLADLDAMESYGVGYDRIEVQLETENGPIKAITYVGLPAFIDDTRLPTQRYLNIIVEGAKAAGLSSDYIENLKEQPIQKFPDYPEFKHPIETTTVFDSHSLAEQPHLTALAGAVFDMRGSREELLSLFSLFGGKDMTLFHIKRHDTSTGSETISDFLEKNISSGQKKYINAYLNEYLVEFSYVGRYKYT